jgi:PucR C-terminal helix-turn-helix domain/GGDEF-like domain
LQVLVDALAARIDRAVDVDDHRFRLVVFSSHRGEIDDVRRTSILHREAPADVVRWLINLGVDQSAGLLRIEAAPSLGMRPRVCVPIRFHGLLLGYMWLIEDRSHLSEADLAACVDAARDAAGLMYRERLLDDQARERSRQCVIDLLEGDGEQRVESARTALEQGILAASAAYVAIAADPWDPPIGRVEERAATVLVALERVRRTLHPQGCMVGNLGARGALIVGIAAQRVAAIETRRIAERIIADLRGSAGERWLLGVGPPVAGLVDAFVSYEAALDAIAIARARPASAEVAIWNELGSWAMLSRIPPDELARRALHPGVAKLAQLRDGATLVATLEAYLDNGGDAQATAAELYVHRTSLYGRLRRIEREAEVDLSNGEDRLALHMSLRLGRLLLG